MKYRPSLRFGSNEFGWFHGKGTTSYQRLFDELNKCLEKDVDPSNYDITVKSTKTGVEKLYRYVDCKEWDQGVESWYYKSDDGLRLVLKNNKVNR